MSNELNQSALKHIRRDLMKKTQLLQNLAPPTVNYTTEGSVLIIGAEDLARLAAIELKKTNQLTILANDPITDQNEAYLENLMASTSDIEVFYNKLLKVKGFLGQYQVIVENNNPSSKNTESFIVELSTIAIRKPHFDIILDLSLQPCLHSENLPPGYFYIGQNRQQLNNTLAKIPQLIGQFEKPRYVKINNEICAHERNGINGCNRCLSVCPADAIKSNDSKIEIDPYLCHGAGSCSSICPTSAISYELPTHQALHSYLHQLIHCYQKETQIAPVILFHDKTSETEQINNELVEDILAIELEEITVAAIDHWMAALAWGARQVILLNSATTPLTLTQVLNGEIALANQILIAMEHPQRIHLASNLKDIEIATKTSKAWFHLIPANFTATSKRHTLFKAIDYLNQQAANTKSALAIGNISYGQVNINQKNCTLCLSCAATCPTQALHDGGDKPALLFTEQDCIQCGLCESACPEKAISLVAQINFDPQQRAKAHILKQEDPFKCIVCGMPFATQSMIEHMLTKVGSHSAFSTNIERLKMCGDCRVKDIFETIIDDPEKQLS